MDMPSVLRVLHLEDVPRDAEVVRTELVHGGVACDIFVADGKDEYEAALAREPFDLIICDYNLPGYDGVRALQKAQAMQPDVPVILVSGTIGEEQAVRCLQVGATDYLLKERLSRLVPAVQRAVTEGQARVARKHVEAGLAHSERRKAAILDSVLDCIVTMDASGLIIEFNAAAERTFGFTRAHAIGRSLAELIIPPSLRSAHARGLARYLACRESRVLGRVTETTALTSDGSVIPVELTITVVESPTTPTFVGVLRDITGRKREAETRNRLAAIVDASDDLIIGTDHEGIVTSWNRGAAQTLGYTAAEMVGTSICRVIPASRQDEERHLLDQIIRGDSVKHETVRQARQGRLIDVSTTTSPIRDAAGTVTGASRVSQDITDRKAADVMLRQERDRAQRYLDAPEVFLVALDLDGRITLANRYACQILGWPSEQLLGRDWIETCLPARVRAEVRQQFSALRDGDLSIMATPVLLRSGEERLIEWHNAVQRDGSGQVVGTFSSGTDITERNEAIQALRAAEQRMRFVLQSANVGIWDMDYTTGLLRWSEILEAQYGLEPRTFQGTHAAFMERVYPDDRESLERTIGEARRAGGDFSATHRALWPDGSVRWLSGAGHCILDDQGRVTRGVGISLDVTERRMLEEQYQQAQKMEAVGRLAGGVAHDFNNLLTVILGYGELLLVDLHHDDPRHKDVAEIQKAAESAGRLTRQLLAFSRQEMIAPTRIHLNAVVTHLQGMLIRLIGEDIQVDLKLQPDLAIVKFDRGQIEQIVINLAVNARDAMPTGGILTIQTANVDLDDKDARLHMALAPGRYVALVVTDTGTGMTPEVKARLFDPFFSTKKPGHGTGLGLAMVHGIVAASGGSVTVHTQVGRGSSFEVYFPRAAGGAVADDVPPLAGPAASRGSETILVVEDAHALRLLTTRILHMQGYSVLAAEDAAEALQLFRENPSVDVVLTDVVMPGCSGPELVRRLAEHRPSVKVIYMSGYTDETILRHGILEAEIAFLHKPFTSDALCYKIREVLDA